MLFWCEVSVKNKNDEALLQAFRLKYQIEKTQLAGRFDSDAPD